MRDRKAPATAPFAATPILPALALTLVAFAANSVLGRMALGEGAIGPGAFTAIRLASGAAMLALLALRTRAGRETARAAMSPASAVALFVYAAAFSFAYLRIPAAAGALALFAAVQATMFAGALIGGERPGALRWFGALAALAGLAVLAAPQTAVIGSSALDPLAAVLMAVSGIAWGVFSLIGRRGGAPTPRIAAAFALAAPMGVGLWIVWGALVGFGPPPSFEGVALAVTSGALASAGGYALWYAILPRLRATTAALAQLTVPLITLAGGMALLGEPLTWRFVVASALVLGGVGAATLLGAPPAPKRAPSSDTG